MAYFSSVVDSTDVRSTRIARIGIHLRASEVLDHHKCRTIPIDDGQARAPDRIPSRCRTPEYLRNPHPLTTAHRVYLEKPAVVGPQKLFDRGDTMTPDSLPR